MNDYHAMSRRAAELVADALRARPDATIAVPTGATPQGFYLELAALHQQGAFDASRLRVFQLDEYVGVAADDPRSFYAWLERVFLRPLGIASAQVTRLRGDAADVQQACAEYDAALREAGGLDLAALGLGANGHIGFNEPPADPASPTHETTLSAETIAANTRYWGAGVSVPTRAVTCGMANLLAARMQVVLVAGAEKHAILRRVLDGPVSAQVPASWLWRCAGCVIVADAAAWGREPSAIVGSREE
ncbi:MAG: glucosamine-6-phosphate deaminase [Chloroflexota bacterium]|nr:glucosamine-6-phosphate deaminase [Chloroflexota bacterium]